MNLVHLYLKYIQKGETRKKYYLKEFTRNGNLEFWNEFLEEDVQATATPKGGDL